jgi:hypothetical protein
MMLARSATPRGRENTLPETHKNAFQFSLDQPIPFKLIKESPYLAFEKF